MAKVQFTYRHISPAVSGGIEGIEGQIFKCHLTKGLHAAAPSPEYPYEISFIDLTGE
jgi:hypothetical protein